MSNGPFQNLPGSREMAGHSALPTVPWLLPISDDVTVAGDQTDALLHAVHRSGRPFRLALQALIATLVLVLAVQITTGWMGAGASHRPNHQVATAPSSAMPIANAALTVSN